MAALAIFLAIVASLLCFCSCSQDAIAPRKPQHAPRSCIDGFLSRPYLDLGFPSVQPAIQPGFPIWGGENALSSAYPLDGSLSRPYLDLGLPSVQPAIQPGFPIWSGENALSSAYPLELGLISATLPPYVGLATSKVIKDAVFSAPTNSSRDNKNTLHFLSKSGLRSLKELLLWPIIASKSLIVTAVYGWFFAELRFIPSRSMMPTLQIGDRVIVEKVSYFFKNPEVNDIVLFRPPPSVKGEGYSASVVFIKRVIAKAGDSVEVKEGTLFVNGIARTEKFTAGPPAYKMSTLHVPKGSVFVLGDNRDFSYDSHIWGSLPIRDILGRAVYRYWPPERAGSIMWEEPATPSLLQAVS